MPQIPTYDNPQVTAAPIPGARLTNSATPELLGSAANSDIKFGDAMTKAGGETVDIGIKMQERDNLRSVQDAVADYGNRLLDYQTDVKTNKVGLAAQGAVGAFSEWHQKQVSEISDRLTNDEQRRAFGVMAGKSGLAGRHDIATFEIQETRKANASAYEADIANNARLGAMAATPEAAATFRSNILASTRAFAASNNMPAQQEQAMLARNLGEFHAGRINQMLRNAPLAEVDAYVRNNAGEISPSDLLKAQDAIGKAATAQLGAAKADTVYRQAAPEIHGDDFTRAWNILKGQESGNRQVDAQGRTITSRAGALGIAQVMPGTGPEAAKLAGLPWDLNRLKTDSAYNEALGKAYFAEQLRTFGRLDYAYAAYNAGPGAVKAAIAKVEKANAGGFGDVVGKNGFANNDIRAYLPDETQDYVTKNMRRYGEGGGIARPTLEDLHEQLRRDPDLARNPAALKLAQDDVTRRFGESDKAIKQREEEGEAAAQRWLVANGGQFSQMPADIRAGIPAKKVDDLLTYAGRIRKGEDSTDPIVYQKLATDPAYLKGLGEAAFFNLRKVLSESDFKHFASMRGTLISGKPGDSEVNNEAINTVLNTRLRTMGLDPTPKDSDTSANMRIGAIRKFVRDNVTQAQAANGKRLTDIEVERVIDKLFVQKGAVSGWFWLPRTPDRMLNMQASDIPSDVKKQLTQDFEARGVKPTDADLLGAYWRAASRPPKRVGASGGF
jgi:soluble lytic murein transglycosylase